nr:hypothetical protein [Tanacetum cinerariifolium]
LGDHTTHWANYLRELVRELSLHYHSWRQMSPERKAGVVAKIGQHLQKLYNDKMAALKERYWVPKKDGTCDVERIRRRRHSHISEVPEEDGRYDLEGIRCARPSHTSEADWVAQLAFWNDPKNLARAAQNKQNQAKSKVVCRQGSRSIAAFRDMHMETSATREYSSLIYTFFMAHTVGGVFVDPEDKALYVSFASKHAL